MNVKELAEAFEKLAKDENVRQDCPVLFKDPTPYGSDRPFYIEIEDVILSVTDGTVTIEGKELH